MSRSVRLDYDTLRTREQARPMTTIYDARNKPINLPDGPEPADRPPTKPALVPAVPEVTTLNQGGQQI
ncbi:hypothetical protein HOU49_gp51 [Arthrobacter phage Eileen]|uniref:Uncharacterized protein n=1 Tax=Arthrobacter phage Eileen TaxID=2419956 RepID=A0A3G2KFT0_9CAUD|nr:hypothetical protein HOU49_gp51 [Arthrobacter phage Eileen]AYN57839.1 hypothetical protein PBI_EILEEN_51 [Arthrobacter phage Eileen]